MKIKVKSLPMEELAELLELQLRSGGVARLPVTGYSMLPMLRNGRDGVALIRTEAQPKRGDIILYRRESGPFVLHRIVALEGDHYICCGDNQASPELVQPEQVRAVVAGYFREDSYHSLEAPGYRLYRALWVGLFPLRRYYIAIRRRLGKLRRRLKTRR